MARTWTHLLRALSLLLVLTVARLDAQEAEPEAPAETAASEAAASEAASSKATETEADKPAEAPAKTEADSDKADDKADDAKKETDGTNDAQEAEEDDVLAGHSQHGEVFNDGPRQSAYLMEGTGKVDFPVTTKNELAQRFFEQGVGQLHGFWYFEAERSFRQAATLDPDCAMNYWGMAMANLSNSKRAKDFIAEAVERKANAGPREVRYIDALNAYVNADSSKKKERSEAYTKALEEILYEYPDDLEAKAFLALQIYKNKSAGISPQSYLTVDALIGEILDVEPMHPVHHYRIHWWDAKRPQMALESATLCGQSAPGIAHMWHMPGHIFSKLKRYEDAVWQQEASARVDHAHMMRDRVLPDQIHNFAHNNEWLIRNLSNVGRVRDAVDLAKNMVELPRHPDHNTLSKRGSAYYGRLRLFEVLNRWELRDEMIALCNSPYLEPTDDEAEQVKRLRLLGSAYYETGDVENGDAQLADARERIEKVEQEQDEAVEKAVTKAEESGKDAKAVAKAKSDAQKPFATRLRRLRAAVNELEGRQAIAGGDHASGLLQLVKAGGIDKLELARVRFLADNVDQAIKEARAEVASKKNEVYPHAILVDLLWRSDKKKEAKAAFGELRKLSRSIDLESPVFARLAPIARELGLPEDWRTDEPPPTDVGVRPALDTLGPFRWQPSPAPQWTLKDAEGRTHTLEEYRGRPLVVIFYLGYGCLHCAEQLQAYGPMAKDFEALGMPLVAISTDDQDGLKQSIEDYDGGPMPIQLLTNADLDVFKAYRCFDDFEGQPLHGTFVVDGDGLVRWQDISYEPSKDPKFVLQEAARLLAQSRVAPVATPGSEPVEEPSAPAEETPVGASSAAEGP